MKSDLRVRYTKKVIKDSFLELLSEKQVYRISVKELCERAKINRATFYGHYNDIYALTEELQNDAIAEIKSLLSKHITNGDDAVLCFIKLLKNNKQYYNKMIFSDDTSKFFNRLYTEYKDEILSHWFHRESKLEPAQREWLFTFLASGSIGIIRTWLIDGMKESAEEVADFINQLTNRYSTFL